jgi:hypothetical protein
MPPIAQINIRADPHYRAHAFSAGLKRVGCVIGTGLDAPSRRLTLRDLLVLWNKKAGREELAADDWEKRGGTVLVVENGYMGNKPKEVTYYAISVHGHNGSGWYPWSPQSEDRFTRLGIELKPPQENPDGFWLVCGQRGIGSSMMASPPLWGEKTAKKLSLAFGPKRVHFRPHPGNFVPKTSLKDDLKGAHMCVIWSSASGITALCEGINVQYSAPHWIAAGAQMLLGFDNRRETLERVAHGQWHVDEIATGEPFARILAHIEEATWR